MHHDQAHPPDSSGATSRELGIVQRLHRSISTTDAATSRPTMLDGLGLLVSLIKAWNRRHSLTDHWDHRHAEKLARRCALPI